MPGTLNFPPSKLAWDFTLVLSQEFELEVDVLESLI